MTIAKEDALAILMQAASQIVTKDKYDDLLGRYEARQRGREEAKAKALLSPDNPVVFEEDDPDKGLGKIPADEALITAGLNEEDGLYYAAVLRKRTVDGGESGPQKVWAVYAACNRGFETSSEAKVDACNAFPCVAVLSDDGKEATYFGYTHLIDTRIGILQEAENKRQKKRLKRIAHFDKNKINQIALARGPFIRPPLLSNGPQYGPLEWNTEEQKADKPHYADPIPIPGGSFLCEMCGTVCEGEADDVPVCSSCFEGRVKNER